MNEPDVKTIKMLENLIENLNAGNISTISRHGELVGGEAVITLKFNGSPEIPPSV